MRGNAAARRVGTALHGVVFGRFVAGLRRSAARAFCLDAAAAFVDFVNEAMRPALADHPFEEPAP